MNTDDVTKYKIEALEKRMDAYEHKIDLILAKLDAMKETAIKTTCPAPGTCVTLSITVANLTKAVEHLQTRQEKQQEHLEKFDSGKIDELEEAISSIKLWRNWLVGLTVPIIAVFGFFAEEIKLWLLHK